jgi:hypothetical protein
MASKYKPTKANEPVHSGDHGNRVVFADNCVATGDLVAADALNAVKIPAGTLVDRVVIKNPDLDSATALTAKIGFAPTDGSAGVSGADVAVSADAAWGRAAATTTYEIFPPYKVLVDSYLSVVVGTGATASSGGGTVYGKVEGENLGVK